MSSPSSGKEAAGSDSDSLGLGRSGSGSGSGTIAVVDGDNSNNASGVIVAGESLNNAHHGQENTDGNDPTTTTTTSSSSSGEQKQEQQPNSSLLSTDNILLELPVPLLVRLLATLSPTDVSALARTCRALRSFVSNIEVWEHLLMMSLPAGGEGDQLLEDNTGDAYFNYNRGAGGRSRRLALNGRSLSLPSVGLQGDHDGEGVHGNGSRQAQAATSDSSVAHLEGDAGGSGVLSDGAGATAPVYSLRSLVAAAAGVNVARFHPEDALASLDQTELAALSSRWRVFRRIGSPADADPGRSGRVVDSHADEKRHPSTRGLPKKTDQRWFWQRWLSSPPPPSLSPAECLRLLCLTRVKILPLPVPLEHLADENAAGMSAVEVVERQARLRLRGRLANMPFTPDGTVATAMNTLKMQVKYVPVWRTVYGVSRTRYVSVIVPMFGPRSSVVEMGFNAFMNFLLRIRPVREALIRTSLLEWRFLGPIRAEVHSVALPPSELRAGSLGWFANKHFAGVSASCEPFGSLDAFPVQLRSMLQMLRFPARNLLQAYTGTWNHVGKPSDWRAGELNGPHDGACVSPRGLDDVAPGPEDINNGDVDDSDGQDSDSSDDDEDIASTYHFELPASSQVVSAASPCDKSRRRHRRSLRTRVRALCLLNESTPRRSWSRWRREVPFCEPAVPAAQSDTLYFVPIVEMSFAAGSRSDCLAFYSPLHSGFATRTQLHVARRPPIAGWKIAKTVGMFGGLAGSMWLVTFALPVLGDGMRRLVRVLLQPARTFLRHSNSVATRRSWFGVLDHAYDLDRSLRDAVGFLHRALYGVVFVE